MARRQTWTKLAAISVGDGREAAIWMDGAGRSRLCADGAGIVVVTHPIDPLVIAVPDGTLAGGRLLPRASDVEVRAPIEPREMIVVGDAYLALLPAPLNPARVRAVFRDSAGRIVRWEPPEVLKREPVDDAHVTCSACGGTAWDDLELRADEREQFTRRRIAVCRTCGRPEGDQREAGRRRTALRDADAEIALALARPRRIAALTTPAAVVLAADFDVYGPAISLAGRRTLAKCGWHGDRVASVSIQYGGTRGRRRTEALVTTRLIEYPEYFDARSDARSALADLISDGHPDADRLSEAARGLLASELERAATLQAADAELDEIDIPVDDQALRFTRARLGARWSAVVRAESVAVILQADALDPAETRLETINDPERYFAA